MESGWKAVDVTPGYYYNVATLQKMVNTPEQIKKNAALKNNGYKGKQTAGSGKSDRDLTDKMKSLLAAYNAKEQKTFEDILDFHVKFEKIHPFQDGNGRVGRLIMFKECLKYNIVPFIIDDNLKLFYYRGLKEWNNEKGYLTDTCLTAQDKYKSYLDYFRIEYDK